MFNFLEKAAIDMSAESTINAKGQTTVPAEIRKRSGVTPGTRLVWHAFADGTIIVRAKTRTILETKGLLQASAGLHVFIEDMTGWADPDGNA